MSLSPDNMMDPTNSFLGRELLEEITPVVMVLTTNLAEDACQKNGLNFLEMLLPFSIFNRIDGEEFLACFLSVNIHDSFASISKILMGVFCFPFQFLFVQQTINLIGCKCSSSDCFILLTYINEVMRLLLFLLLCFMNLQCLINLIGIVTPFSMPN